MLSGGLRLIGNAFLSAGGAEEEVSSMQPRKTAGNPGPTVSAGRQCDGPSAARQGLDGASREDLDIPADRLRRVSGLPHKVGVDRGRHGQTRPAGCEPGRPVMPLRGVTGRSRYPQGARARILGDLRRQPCAWQCEFTLQHGAEVISERSTTGRSTPGSTSALAMKPDRSDTRQCRARSERSDGTSRTPLDVTSPKHQ